MKGKTKPKEQPNFVFLGFLRGPDLEMPSGTEMQLYSVRLCKEKGPDYRGFVQVQARVAFCVPVIYQRVSQIIELMS